MTRRPNILPPEFEALLACLYPGAGGDEKLRATLGATLDWDLLLDQAMAHGVATRLFRGIESAGFEGVPKSFYGRLEHHTVSVIAHNLPRLEQLTAALGSLEKAGVLAVPFKGPALAARLAQDPLTREFVDLDVLVSRRNIIRAADALVAEGYHLHDLEKWRADVPQCHLQKHYLFVPPDRGKVMIELHAELMEPYWAIGLSTEDLLDRAGATEFEGRIIHELAAPDLLLALALHGTSHGWGHLMWLGDLSALSIAVTREQVETSLDLASSIGCRRILLYSCQLIGNLLGAPLTPEIDAALGNDPSAVNLARRTATRLAQPLAGGGPLRLPLLERFRIRERPADRLRCAVEHARKGWFHLASRVPKTRLTSSSELASAAHSAHESGHSSVNEVKVEAG